MPAEEHRRNPRVKLKDLAYINLGSENGGIVLDVSGGGFGLQLAAPLVDLNTIRFQLSMASIEGMEATGEVAWRDETKKRVGLRVTYLPVEIREQVRIWLGYEPLTWSELNAAPAPAATSANVPAANEMELGFAEQRGLDLQEEQRISDERRNPLSAEKIEAVPSPGQPFCTSPNLISGTGELTSGPTEPEVNRSRPVDTPLSMFSSNQTIEKSADAVSPRHSLAYAAFILTFAVVLCIGVVGYFHMRGIGELLIRLGEKISGESPPSAIGPSFPPAAPANVGSAPNRDITADQTETHDIPSGAIPKAPPSAAQAPGRLDTATANPMPVNSDQENGGQSDLALARKYLRERSSPEYAAEAEKLLWSAIEKGNTSAEVELADQYLSGDELPKNCEQARVLYMAASQSKNAAAAERLANFPKNECE